jgi:hypothetical protein
VSVKEIGCCCAYCRTCRAYKTHCKGCKVGYDTGQRDIGKARCKVKVCCLTRGLATCADCSEYSACGIVGDLYGKSGYKYGKYQQALDYIRGNGYEAFLRVANRWTNAYGRCPSQARKRRAAEQADAAGEVRNGQDERGLVADPQRSADTRR